MTVIEQPDDAVAARLLAGHPSTADLAGEYGTVARLLVCAGGSFDESSPEPAFLTAMQESVVEGGRVTGFRPRRGRRVVVRGLVVAGVVGFGATTAAAVNGTLPGIAQDTAHEIADLVGLDIPRAGSADGPGHGHSDEAPGRPVEPGSNGGGVGPDGTPPGEGGAIPGAGIGAGAVVPGHGGPVPADGEAPDDENRGNEAPRVPPGAVSENGNTTTVPPATDADGSPPANPAPGPPSPPSGQTGPADPPERAGGPPRGEG